MDLANAKLSSDEAMQLARAIAYAENGLFRNVSVLGGIAKVVLDGVNLGDSSVAVLAGAFGSAVALPLNVSLAVSNAGIAEAGALSLAKGLSATGSTIASLRLDWNANVGDVGAEAIGKALHGNRVLRVLGLERCGVGDLGATGLAASLATAPTSTAHAATVAAGGEAIAAAEAAAVASAASSLRELYLEGNRIGPTGAAALSVALRNSHLEHLGLALNPIGPDGAASLAEALKHNNALLSLDLANCGIGDDGAVALGGALRNNQVLRELRLQGNGIRARGSAALAEALRINPVGLRSLNLRLNRLDEPAAKALLDAVKHAKSVMPQAGQSLASLSLEYNRALPEVGHRAPQPVLAATLEAISVVASHEYVALAE